MQCIEYIFLVLKKYIMYFKVLNKCNLIHRHVKCYTICHLQAKILFAHLTVSSLNANYWCPL